VAQISTIFDGLFGWPKTGFEVSKREFSDPKSVQFLKIDLFTPLHESENPAISNPQSSENRIPILSKKLTRLPDFSLDDSPKTYHDI
jgi:hypothetical protein